jgi:hypothetical protein
MRVSGFHIIPRIEFISRATLVLFEAFPEGLDTVRGKTSSLSMKSRVRVEGRDVECPGVRNIFPLLSELKMCSPLQERHIASMHRRP